MRSATLAFAVCLAAIAQPGAPAASHAPEVVRVDLSLIESGPEELSLELTPGERRLAYRTGFERTAWGDVVWRGRFADGDPGYAGITLSVHGGVLVGSLRTPEGRAYLLEPRASGEWELRTEEASAFACDVGRERPAALAKALDSGRYRSAPSNVAKLRVPPP